ncbi:MAG: copper-binding protein [Cypionkella sp.]|uniref:copper chaperone PCu(A)C n=1 Tax=Cypionkella sp. TaxID=2811411 RepID=UPI002609AB9C|nr:copper chaperone PCu(A)C [Cypionkella sp.]MDB5661297.1 copper-binding protein [Cypionkella sp.]
MRLTSLIAAALLIAAPAFAQTAPADQGVHIENPYARTSGGIGGTGGIFLEIANHANTDDRLIGVASDIAERVEMHTSTASAGGVMSMSAVPEGFPIPAQQGHALKRGGDHIMLMGLRQKLKNGDVIHLTLTFEKAGVVTLDVPVDNARKPGAVADPMADMPGMDHGTMDAPAN